MCTFFLFFTIEHIISRKRINMQKKHDVINQFQLTKLVRERKSFETFGRKKLSHRCSSGLLKSSFSVCKTIEKGLGPAFVVNACTRIYEKQNNSSRLDIPQTSNIPFPDQSTVPSFDSD